MLTDYTGVEHHDILWLNRFVFGGYEFPSKDTFQQLISEDSSMPPEIAWYYVKAGKPVAQVGYFIHKIHTKEGVKKVGVPYAVGTVPGFRGKGYGRLLMDHVHEKMREQGCEYSILSTSRTWFAYGWYHSQGYTVLAQFSDLYGQINTKNVPIDDYGFRNIKNDEDLTLYTLFNEINSPYLGFSHRSPNSVKIRRLWGDMPVSMKLLEYQGELVGYANVIEKSKYIDITELVLREGQDIQSWAASISQGRDVLITLSPHQVLFNQSYDGLTHQLANGVMLIKNLTTSHQSPNEILRIVGQDEKKFVAFALDRW